MSLLIVILLGKRIGGAAAVLIGIFLSGAVLNTPVVYADGEVAASTATVSTNSDPSLVAPKNVSASPSGDDQETAGQPSSEPVVASSNTVAETPVTSPNTEGIEASGVVSPTADKRVAGSADAVLENTEVADDQEIVVENDFIKQNIVVKNGKLRTDYIENKINSNERLNFLEGSSEFDIHFSAPTIPQYIALSNDRDTWTVSTNSHANSLNATDEGPAALAVDGKLDSIWHTNYVGSGGEGPTNAFPYHVDLSFVETKTVQSVIYVPRQIGTNGDVLDYKIYYKPEENDEFQLAKVGTFSSFTNKEPRIIQLPETVQAKVIRFEVTNSQNQATFASAAELDLSEKTAEEIKTYWASVQEEYSQLLANHEQSSHVSTNTLTVKKNGIHRVTEGEVTKTIIDFNTFTYMHTDYQVRYVIELNHQAHFLQKYLEVKTADDQDASQAIDTIDLQSYKLQGDEKIWKLPTQANIAEMAGFNGFYAGLGQPVYINSFYTGSNFPLTWNTVDDETATVFSRYYSGKSLDQQSKTADGYYRTWNTVFGVARSDDYQVLQQDFYKYIADIGQRTYYRTQYNSWFDHMQNINATNIQESFNEIERGFTNGGVAPLDSYVVDDGWQDMTTLWDFNNKFPNKLYDSSKQARRFDSNFGLWVGPQGGYAEPGYLADNLVTQDLASKYNGVIYIGDNRYVEGMRDVFTNYEDEFDINYWKLDGLLLSPRPDTDTAHYIGGGYRNMYSMTETHERWISLYESIREHATDPDKMWINLTSYIPPSPWFLQWVNSIWMQNSADVDYQDNKKQGEYVNLDFGNDMNEALTYRDDRYEELVNLRKWQLPFANIYNHDPVYGNTANSAKSDYPGGPQRGPIEFSVDDLRTYLYMLGTRGTGFWEFYYSYNKMDDDKWMVNGEAVNWISKNFETLKNARFHGGKPGHGEVYGYSAWDADKGILSIRNPIPETQEYTIKLDRLVGVLEGTSDMHRKVILGNRSHSSTKLMNYGDTLTITLGAYETVIFEFSKEADTQAAQIYKSSVISPNTINLQFDERVFIDNATFTVNGETVSASLKPDYRTVVLTLDKALSNRESVNVTYDKVADLAASPNVSSGQLTLRAYDNNRILDVSEVLLGTPLVDEGVQGRGEFSVTVKANLDRLNQVLASQEGNWTLSVDDLGRAVFNVNGLEVSSAPYLDLKEADKGNPDQLITVGQEFTVTAVRQTNGSLRIYLNGILHDTTYDANQINDVLDRTSVVIGNKSFAGHIDRFILENSARDFETVAQLNAELNPKPYDKDLRDLLVDTSVTSYDATENAVGSASVDGNLATYWASSPNQPNTVTPQYLQLNFKEPQVVDKVTYFARQIANAVGNVELAYLDYSSDGISWKRLPLVNGNADNTIFLNPETLTGQEIRFQPTEMRALRFYGRESVHWDPANDNTIVAVAELVPSIVTIPEVFEKVDVTYLRNALTAAQSLEASTYTEASFAPLAAVLAQQDQLLALNLQESIDQARENLLALVSQLVPVTAEPSPTEPSTPAKPAQELPQLPPVESHDDFVRPNNAIGAITDFQFADGVARISYETGQTAQVQLYNDHVFRYYIDPNGNFQVNPDPSRADRPAIIATKDFDSYKSQYRETGRLITEDTRYIIETDKVWLIFDKETAELSIYDRVHKRYVTREVAPVQLSANSTTQTLSQDANEYFFGGGMQNGRFTHKGNAINIVNENNWVDGGVTSPSPFYWSTNGYGVLRSTFRPGIYDFGTQDKTQITTVHNEDRFDAYFFINDKPFDIIKDYQELTGKPVVLPEYALYLGHLNAYNRDYWVEVKEGTPGAILLDGKWYREYQPAQLPENLRNVAVRETLNGEGNSYTFSARAVIDRYKNYDMPIAWFLPNDGYGAGYGRADTLDGNIANLKAFVEYAKTNGIKVGLWTQSDLVDTDPAKDVVLHRDIDKEVAEAGIRAIKTDVAWVGYGYSFGLNGVDEGAKRLTTQSGSEAARPFIISLDGWAGTQRSAAIWSGDQSGGQWEYIRFHIPTYIGLGLSGNPNMGSDMDGIFGGADPIINARDYQWKMFTSIMMNMDGWGAKPKTPFSFDSRITDINRISLKQKSTLIPYAYSIGHEAAETGKPIVRAMFIDFPDDPLNYTKDVQYQYMYGSNILVAPVYQNTAMAENGDDIRNNIVLPGSDEEWIDWYTGKKYKGGQVLNGFAAPLWKAPVFVRNGAIIPMTNANNNPNEIDRSNRLITFYPHGDTSFTLYEDDGTSIGYKEGQLATTVIKSHAGDSNKKGQVVLTVDQTQGDFDGFKKVKTTELHVNVSEDVASVRATIGGREITLKRVNTLEDYLNGTNVFFYHNDPLMETYNPTSTDIQNLRVVGNDLLKIKLEAVDVTQNAVVVTIDGFINTNDPVDLPEDMTLPTVPTNLGTPEDGISSTSIRVEWTPVANAASYDIEKDGILYTGITGDNFVFADLDFGSTHHFRVRAINAKGVSGWSDLVTAQTDEDPWADAIENIRVTTNITAQPGQEIDKLFDRELGNQFHSDWDNPVHYPSVIEMDLGGVYDVDRIEYYPRNDGGQNGRITKVHFSVSEDGVNWITDHYYSIWKNDSKTKVYTFTVPQVRYIKMIIDGGVNDFISGEELLVFKKPGSRMKVPGDISNDGKISYDDRTSFLNYSGLREVDSDFDYISHADSNKNGLIDAYDISVAAVQLDGGVTSPSQAAPSGNLYLTADKLNLAKGEETTVYLMANELSAVNALTSTFMIDGSVFEVVGGVVANQAFTKDTENFSRVRTRSNQTNVVFSFVNFGQKDLLEGSGTVASIRLRALRDTAVDVTSQDGILVGNDLRTLNLADAPIRQAVTYAAVPTTPSDLVATRVTSESISLTWTDDDQAFDYIIEQETADGFVQIGRAEGTHFDVYNLLPETTYVFRLTARNPLGASQPSAALQASTIAKDLTRKIAIVDAHSSVAEQVNEPLTNLYDGDDTTLYHSDWNNNRAVPSHLIVDLGESQPVDHLIYRPRDNAGNGNIKSLSLEISQDGESWQPVGDVINWVPDNKEKAALLPEGTTARFIKLNWLSSVGGFVSGNELTVMSPSKTDISLPSRVLVDPDTGVKVVLQEGENPLIARISVTHIETGSPETPAILGSQDYDLYDITLLDQAGEKAVNSKDVLVYLPIDQGKKVARVVYLPNTQEEEVLDFSVTTLMTDDGREIPAIVFTTSHFSEYGLVYEAVASNDDSVTSPELPTSDLPADDAKDDFDDKTESTMDTGYQSPHDNPTDRLQRLGYNRELSTGSISPEVALGQRKVAEKAENPYQAALPDTGDDANVAFIVTGLALAILGFGFSYKKR